MSQTGHPSHGGYLSLQHLSDAVDNGVSCHLWMRNVEATADGNGQWLEHVTMWMPVVRKLRLVVVVVVGFCFRVFIGLDGGSSTLFRLLEWALCHIIMPTTPGAG
jgi:hypothetical protein